MEEEYLSNVTGMNINQIHTWCRKSPDPQSYLYTLPNNALSSL